MPAEPDIVFCKGGGCTAKLGPGALSRVLSRLPAGSDPNLLVGFDHADDAAVYRLTDELAIVMTLDFFPPMVDDPYLFGQIAAANALSDIYAMGGEVRTALNIVCFPEQWDLNILGRILQGGHDKVREAGGVLAGGHSINDTDVKYGLSVTGVIHPQRILTNHGCQIGDQLILTKPLGVGIICTASRAGEASAAAMDQAVQSMTMLNKYAAAIIRKYRVHGCTDVTGFGFLGHLYEMVGDPCTAEPASAQDDANPGGDRNGAPPGGDQYGAYGAQPGGNQRGAPLEADQRPVQSANDRRGALIDSMQIPFIREAAQYANHFLLTAAAQRNRNQFAPFVRFAQVPFSMQEILFDPQTSGGLLVSLAAEDAPAALAEIEQLGLPCAIVGTIIATRDKPIVVY